MDPNEWKMSNYYIGVAFFVIFLIGFIGNIIVLLVLLRRRKNWTVSTNSLFNLAVADIIFLCTILLWGYTFIKDLNWIFGLGMCKLAGAITSINMFASIFFLTAMSVERWLAIVHVMSSKAYWTQKVARWMCFGIWCSAILLSTPRFIYQTVILVNPNTTHQNSFTPNNMTEDEIKNQSLFSSTSTIFTATSENQITYIQQKAVCTFLISNQPSKSEIIKAWIDLFQTMIEFVIPMIVISVCYVRIILSVKKNPLCQSNVPKNRVTKLSAVIIAAFFVCWLPLQLLHIYSGVTKLLEIFPHDDDVYHKLYSSALVLAWSNSCVNPIIYAFVAKRFQNSFKQLFCQSKQAANDHKRKKLNCGEQEADNNLCTSETLGNKRYRPSYSTEITCSKSRGDVESVETRLNRNIAE